MLRGEKVDRFILQLLLGTCSQLLMGGFIVGVFFYVWTDKWAEGFGGEEVVSSKSPFIRTESAGMIRT